MKSVNLLALLVVLVAGALVWHGDIDPDAFLLLVTGLAIPARSDGYQSVGTGPVKVEGVPGGEPVPVVPDETDVEAIAPPASRASRVRRARDGGHADLGLFLAVLGAILLAAAVLELVSR